MSRFPLHRMSDVDKGADGAREATEIAEGVRAHFSSQNPLQSLQDGVESLNGAVSRMATSMTAKTIQFIVLERRSEGSALNTDAMTDIPNSRRHPAEQFRNRQNSKV